MLKRSLMIGLIALSAVVAQQPQQAPPPAGTPVVSEAPPAGPGHYEVVKERVWVPATTQRVWVPPVYENAVDATGNPVRIEVAPGQYRDVKIPGRYIEVERKVWVPTPVVLPSPTYSIVNKRTLRIQIQSVHATLGDGTVVNVALSGQREVSANAHYHLDLPPRTVSLKLAFKTYDWANRRFQFPIKHARFDVRHGRVGTVH